METPRAITLRIHLVDGHEQVATLGEDSPDVLALFSALATPGAESQFVQLPLDEGRRAFSFQTSQVVSIVSEPPVVLKFETRPARVPAARGAGRPLTVARAASLRRPGFVVIDDFLSQREHDALLDQVLISQAPIQSGTAATYDPESGEKLAIVDFGQTVHGRLLENRLLMWFPLLARTLGLRPFALAPVESRLTAAQDGYQFKSRSDERPPIPPVLSCLYCLHRDPRGFAGGELRFYDSVEADGARRAAETFSAVTPTANRLVVFPSEVFHDAMPVRCPSGELADSPFAVTARLRRAPRLDPDARFGWGYFRCGVVAPQFAFVEPGGMT